MDKEAGKKRAGQEAAKFVERGMTLGLGTGSTAKHFVDALAPKAADGWQLKGVPTSEATRRHAESIGIEIIEPDETTIIDLAVDGTDEADPNLNLIKGGGGALLREKIVANAAQKFIVIADKSKRVAALGAFPLPIEIEPFGWATTIRNIRTGLKTAGFDNLKLELRIHQGEVFKSDGNHLIADCALGRIDDPATLDQLLGAIPGVIETGLFCGLTDIIIYGDEDGVSIEKA